MTWGAIAGTLIVGAYQAGEAEDAEDAQFAANNRALSAQEGARDDFSRRVQPYSELGLTAGNALAELLGLPQSIEGTAELRDMSREIADLDAKIAERQQYVGSDNLVGRLVAQRELPELLRRREELSQSLSSARTSIQNSPVQPNSRQTQIDEINPVLSFLRDEGFEDIQESAAARGRLGAGGTLEELTQYNNNLAATIVPQLQNQRFNQLFNLLTQGQNAAVGAGTASLQTANNSGNILGSIGTNQAQGIINKTNAITDTAGSVAEIYGQNGGNFNFFNRNTSPGSRSSDYTGNAMAEWIGRQ